MLCRSFKLWQFVAIMITLASVISVGIWSLAGG